MSLVRTRGQSMRPRLIKDATRLSCRRWSCSVRIVDKIKAHQFESRPRTWPNYVSAIALKFYDFTIPASVVFRSDGWQNKGQWSEDLAVVCRFSQWRSAGLSSDSRRRCLVSSLRSTGPLLCLCGRNRCYKLIVCSLARAQLLFDGDSTEASL